VKYLIERLIHDLRIGYSMTDSELARHFGFHPVYISRMKHGQRVPRRVIDSLCYGLGMTWSDFFSFGGMPLSCTRAPKNEEPIYAHRYRGHEIYEDASGEWRYVDTDEPTVTYHKQRPCGHCNQHATPEGHDACLGTLPGVINACCGHGNPEESYIMFESGLEIREFTIAGERQEGD